MEVPRMNCSQFLPLLMMMYFLILCRPAESVVEKSHLSAKERKECDDTSATITHDNLEDVLWFKKCVVKYYGLQPLKGEINFLKPQFRAYLRNPIPASFQQTGMRIQRFFKRNDDWSKTKANPMYNNPVTKDSSNLLAITDARYLYVTFLLFDLSGKQMRPCAQDASGFTIVPATVCFLRPYGSASATSDYDVGLVGRTSGSLTVAFNEYFHKAFSKPSEQVFDTNIYGFSLEYAVPEVFSGLSLFYNRVLPQLDFEPQFQMLELAGAYMKMYRYNSGYYARLKKFAEENLGGLGMVKEVKNYNLYFKKWIARFEELDKKKPLKGGKDLRQKHNEEYNAIIKDVENVFDSRYTSDITQYVLKMSKALIYAAEAYHTRGAIRHVVGSLQLNVSKSSLTVLDYWVSMIENWADANKVYGHCKGPAELCLLSMAKYLYRTFNAMKEIHMKLVNPVKIRNALVTPIKQLLQKYPIFGTKNDPEVLTRGWVFLYKGKVSQIPYDAVLPFLKSVGCTTKEQPPATNLAPVCWDKIEGLIEAYDHLLVSTTNKAATEHVILVTTNGQVKTRPVYQRV